MADSRFVYVTYIRAAPEKVWEALTTSDFIRQYFLGATFESDWKVGAPFRVVLPDGRTADSGEILEFTPPTRLVLKWRNEFVPEAHAEGYSRFVAEVEPAGDATKLSITHSIDVENSKLIDMVSGGWSRILSNLKSLLETPTLTELPMSDESYATHFTVEQSPEAVFAAINNVRGWWSAGIVGDSATIGGKFTHSVLDLHRCDLMVTHLVPGRKVAWTVLANDFSFTKDKTEWVGTDIVFDISRTGDKTRVDFRHVGLVPEYECYEICNDGWQVYITSLRALIATGKGDPNIGEAKTDSEHELVRSAPEMS
jgi:uncharacterized protein YndB with AHSA1/START domain